MTLPQRDTASPTGPDSDGLRSRARRAMRAEVAAIALDLFVEQGFDNTTIEQIAAAAGMSRSSFFRYFPTKEDVVVGDLAAYGEQILQALIKRPDSEPIWTALRAALEPVVDTGDIGLARRNSRLFLDTPALKGRHYEKMMTWQALLIPEVARRLSLPDFPAEDPRPAALISGALGCLDAALAAWARREDHTSLAEVLDLAMDSLRPAAALTRG